MAPGKGVSIDWDEFFYLCITMDKMALALDTLKNAEQISGSCALVAKPWDSLVKITSINGLGFV